MIPFGCERESIGDLVDRRHIETVVDLGSISGKCVQKHRRCIISRDAGPASENRMYN